MPLPEHFHFLLLDMNSTFMFGEDQFGPDEDYFSQYCELGGRRSEEWVREAVDAAFAYLEIRYPDPEFRYRFPTVADSFRATSDANLTDRELQILVDLFALRERGHIPDEFAAAIRRLASKFKLGLVADIWASPRIWREAFEKSGIFDCFSAMSFSSEAGAVKPAPEPFVDVLEKLGAKPEDSLFVGDSARRDLGGAKAAEIPCVLVGGAEHEDAAASYPTLLEFVEQVAA